MLGLMVKFFLISQKNSNIKTWKYLKSFTSQRVDYTTGCLLDYSYVNKNYKMIAIDLSKQLVLDASPRATQQMNFTVNLDRDENTTMFFIIEDVKETVLEFSQGTIKVL